MTDTPRTDAEQRVTWIKDSSYHILTVSPDFARQLERELVSFCKVLGCEDLTPSGNVVSAMVNLNQLIKERGQLRAELERLKKELATRP